MTVLDDIAAWLGGPRIEPREIRAEIWALGSRHRGRPLEGARIELQADGLSARRTTLLRAVIRSLTPPTTVAVRR